MGRVVTVALVVALLSPASSPGRPSRASVRLADAVALARTYWPEVCEPVSFGTAPNGYGGVAWTMPCRWALAADWPTWPWRSLCPLVVHEFGHLAGRPHSRNRWSVMYGGPLAEQRRICGPRPRRTPVHRRSVNDERPAQGGPQSMEVPGESPGPDET